MLWPFSNIVEKSWIADAGLRTGVAGASPLPAALVRRGDRRLLHPPDANGQALAYVYFEEEPGRRSPAHLLNRDEGRRRQVPPPRRPQARRSAIAAGACKTRGAAAWVSICFDTELLPIGEYPLRRVRGSRLPEIAWEFWAWSPRAAQTALDER
jgi:hypothetical protein